MNNIELGLKAQLLGKLDHAISKIEGSVGYKNGDQTEEIHFRIGDRAVVHIHDSHGHLVSRKVVLRNLPDY